MKTFEGLLKSEIKKANAFATKMNGKKTEITGYSYNPIPDELGFVTVRCEMCSNNMTERENDILLLVPMFDRRMTRATRAF